jgi:hypothetical protein
MRKWILIVAAAAIVLLVLILHGLGPRVHALVRARTEKILQTHFESQIEFSDFRVSVLPRIHVTISKLVLRHKGRTDIPPLIQVRTLTMNASALNLLRAKPHVSAVQLDGLEIHIPPRRLGDEPLIQRTDQDLAQKYPVIIDEMHADNAIIVILRGQPDKPPQEFLIHKLELRDLSFDRPAKFQATLTNSVPPGEIDSHGEFGPWEAEVPSTTRAVGEYTFRNADLAKLKGIRGTLSSEGKFSGPLDYLDVAGTTDVPDFCLRIADHPMALHTEFSATVDGTNGDTYLKRVTARFQHTTIVVGGKVTDEDPSVKGRTILLDATAQEARVEDLIRLAVKGEEPIMTGVSKVRAKISIPEGDSDLIQRLEITGQFQIGNGEFTAPQIQEKVDTLSRKGQGEPKEMDINKVAAEMGGSFRLREGVMTFSNLNFGVVGASVNLAGTYTLDGGALDFHGRLVMQAKLSQTTTGAKAFFLKALDPFFKGKNAGTVLAIKITGTKDSPSFGLDHGHPVNKDEAPAPKASK